MPVIGFMIPFQISNPIGEIGSLSQKVAHEGDGSKG